ncbi:hypothetical protein IAU59_002511 [Kwoniella sp. CBS 9459]
MSGPSSFPSHSECGDSPSDPSINRSEWGSSLRIVPNPEVIAPQPQPESGGDVASNGTDDGSRAYSHARIMSISAVTDSDEPVQISYGASPQSSMEAAEPPRRSGGNQTTFSGSEAGVFQGQWDSQEWQDFGSATASGTQSLRQQRQRRGRGSRSVAASEGRASRGTRLHSTPQTQRRIEAAAPKPEIRAPVVTHRLSTGEIYTETPLANGITQGGLDDGTLAAWRYRKTSQYVGTTLYVPIMSTQGTLRSLNVHLRPLSELGQGDGDRQTWVEAARALFAPPGSDTVDCRFHFREGVQELLAEEGLDNAELDEITKSVSSRVGTFAKLHTECNAVTLPASTAFYSGPVPSSTQSAEAQGPFATFRPGPSSGQ